ncbi:ALAAT1, partial [Symbiodinium microadriaticum]
VLTEERVREVAMWCKNNNILLLADEVYQENIWDPNARFTSFRKAAYDLDLFADENPLQLISFH